MFRNYAHRAEVFVDAVRELAAEAGQPCMNALRGTVCVSPFGGNRVMC